MKALLYPLLCLASLMQALRISAQTTEPALKITHLTGDFYVYTTYKPVNGNPFPSNSMYLVTSKGVVMFDTPWDTTQFKPLMDSIQARHNKPVVLCIATHSHDDRTAGMSFLQHNGVPTYSSKLTYELCAEHPERRPEHYFTGDTTITIGNHTFQTYYPGEGHTKDNIVIWFANEKILYGGCLVKSIENNGLGNVADANISAWAPSIKKVMKRFRKPTYVIPGHFGWSGKKALKHTLKLIKKAR